MKRRCCYFCQYIQGKGADDDFTFWRGVSGDAANPEAAACEDFAPREATNGDKMPESLN